jgi:hypothetical protein
VRRQQDECPQNQDDVGQIDDPLPRRKARAIQERWQQARIVGAPFRIKVRTCY